MSHDSFPATGQSNSKGRTCITVYVSSVFSQGLCINLKFLFMLFKPDKEYPNADKSQYSNFTLP